MLLQDAVVAIALMDSCTAVDSGSVLPAGCAIPTNFEDDPDAKYAVMADVLIAAVRSGGIDLLTWGEDL